MGMAMSGLGVSWISLPADQRMMLGWLRSRLDGVGGVAEGPFFEVEVVVVGILGDGPAVEHLVHDEEAHAVGEVEELGRGWVVGGADGVDAEGAESSEAALPCGERDGGAECAGIGVEGYAVDLVVDAVEEEALVGIEVELADAEGDGFVVDGFAVLRRMVVDGVEGGVVEVPAVGIGDGGISFKVGGGVRGRWWSVWSGINEPDGQTSPVGTDESMASVTVAADIGIVGDCGAHMNCGDWRGDLRGGDEGAPWGDVDGVGGDEADMAVDACAGIPAGGGLLGVVDADGDGVFAGVEVRGEVVVEADVTVGAVAEEFSVAVDVGVGHDAVEGDEGALGGVEIGKGERLAIPGDAGGEEASGGAAWCVFFDGASDAPVVWEGDDLPLGVVEGGGLGAGGVGLGEAPVGVERLDEAGLCQMQSGEGGGGEYGGSEKKTATHGIP